MERRTRQGKAALQRRKSLFPLPEAGLDLREFLQAVEFDLIDQALKRTGGNKLQASVLLGLNRTTLLEKLRRRPR